MFNLDEFHKGVRTSDNFDFPPFDDEESYDRLIRKAISLNNYTQAGFFWARLQRLREMKDADTDGCEEGI